MLLTVAICATTRHNIRIRIRLQAVATVASNAIPTRYHVLLVIKMTQLITNELLIILMTHHAESWLLKMNFLYKVHGTSSNRYSLFDCWGSADWKLRTLERTVRALKFRKFRTGRTARMPTMVDRPGPTGSKGPWSKEHAAYTTPIMNHKFLKKTTCKS